MKPLELLRHPKFALHRIALLFAVAGTGILGVGVGLIWRTLERDNAAFVQQSIGDTGSMLATQVRLEVDRLKRIVLELGELRILPRLGTHENEISMESDPEILAVSLWRRSGAPLASSRVYVGINPRFAGILSDASVAAIRSREAGDRVRIEPGFEGQARVVTTTLEGWSKPLALLVVPIASSVRGESEEVLSALVSLDKIQKFFGGEGLVQSKLVDVDGIALAHSNPERVGRVESEAVQLPGTGIESGIQALTTPDGRLFYGGFRRISKSGLAVLSSVPAEETGSSLDGIRRQLLVYLALVFLALGGGRYWWLNKHPRTPPEPATLAERGPKKVAIVSLHGSMRGFNQLLENGGAQEAADALNDFLAFSAAIVRASGGHFESQLGASFGAAWEIEDGNAAGPVERAMACTLLLRTEFACLNEARKVDGKKPLRYGTGLHVGLALRARLGVVPELRESVTGEAPACARALDRIGLATASDCVVSHAVLKSSHGIFSGQILGETKLTADTGLTACYAIDSFRAEPTLAENGTEAAFEVVPRPIDVAPFSERVTGGETREVQLAGIAGEAKVARWLVNNGSQIVGPYTAAELARMLFAQELDFDCECWHEETGRASRLETAGIFSGGSEDADASHWVFDGNLIHGPVTDGFIRTALSHGAFGADAYVCDNSTIAGWRKLSSATEEVTSRKPETDSGDEAA